MRHNRQSLAKRFFSSRLFLLSAFIVTVAVALGYARAYYQDYQIKQEVRALQEEVNKLEQRKIQSLDILRYVMSEDFVEEKARTELNLRKPGEKVLVVNTDNSAVSSSSAIASESIRPLKNPVKWWYYFSSRRVE